MVSNYEFHGDEQYYEQEYNDRKEALYDSREDDWRDEDV